MHVLTALMSSALVFGENVVPEQVMVRWWNHAGELMERIEDEIEARALLSQWLVIATRQSHAVTMACISDTYCKKPATCIP